jgi:Tol biopolymer transport system component
MKRLALLLALSILLLTGCGSTSPAPAPLSETNPATDTETVETIPVIETEADPPATEAPTVPSRPGKLYQVSYETVGGPAYISTQDGSQSELLLRDTASYWIQSWTPDGQSLLVKDTNDEEFYLLTPDTEETGPCLTCDIPEQWSIVVSPSAQKIVFATSKGIFLAENGETRSLSNQAGLYPLEWSADEQSVLLIDQASNDLYLLDLGNANLTNLTGSLMKDQIFNAALSPDGQKIAFHLIRDGKVFLLITDRDGTNVTQIADVSPKVETRSSETSSASVDWSPDSSRLAFSILQERSDYVNNEDVYVANADGSNLTQLTDHTAQDWYPRWSPDGSHIAFISNRTGAQDIWVMAADGSGLVNITNTPDDVEYNPLWRP